MTWTTLITFVLRIFKVVKFTIYCDVYNQETNNLTLGTLQGTNKIYCKAFQLFFYYKRALINQNELLIEFNSNCMQFHIKDVIVKW